MRQYVGMCNVTYLVSLDGEADVRIGRRDVTRAGVVEVCGTCRRLSHSWKNKIMGY